MSGRSDSNPRKWPDDVQTIRAALLPPVTYEERMAASYALDRLVKQLRDANDPAGRP
jgi:hypothetical protein